MEVILVYTNKDANMSNGVININSDYDGLADYDSGEVDYIEALDVIDFIPRLDLEKTIKLWVSKVCIGGRIAIGGTDLHAVCRAFHRYDITLWDTNQLLHGDEGLPRITQFSLIGLAELLESFGLKILKKRLDGFMMLVEAQRV